MILKLNETWHERLIEYLKEEASLNLFIISDLENFGYNTDFQEVWGDINQDGFLQGVLLRYMGNYLAYAKEKINASEFSSIIQNGNDYEMLSGKKEITDQFAPYLTFRSSKESYFAELKSMERLDQFAPRNDVFIATVDDVDDLMELRLQIKEFTLGPMARNSLIQSLTTNTGRTYFMRKDNKTVTCASTTAENSYSAMIVGVCSHSDFRQFGYASQCMTLLCLDVLNEGKSLCLFYNNPKAGSIYKRLGFTDIGIWSMNYPLKKEAAAASNK